MNIYDTRLVHCTKCGKFIGEIEHDSQVVMPMCGRCNTHMTGNILIAKIRK